MEWCTNIYPVFAKMKKDNHVIFPESVLDTEHLRKEDYRVFNEQVLNNRINKDVSSMLKEVLSYDKKYVELEKEGGIKLSDKEPNTSTYLFFVIFNKVKYLFTKCMQMYVLVNYSMDSKDICYKGEHFRWEYLPRGKETDYSICYLNQYGKYLVNTYEAFCGFCEILGIERCKSNNIEFYKHIVNMNKDVDMQDLEPYYHIIYEIEGQKMLVSFIRTEQLLIAIDWERYVDLRF